MTCLPNCAVFALTAITRLPPACGCTRLVARLSLQEQRINTLGRQLIDVNAQLETVTRERTAQEESLKQFESAIVGGTIRPEMPREDAERELANQRMQASRTRAREQQLRTQATDIAGSLAAEQDR
jgi:hypothetical protein